MLCSSLLRLLYRSSIHLSQSRFKHTQIDGERSSRIILCNPYLVDLLSTKWCLSCSQKVTMLREAIIQNEMALKFCVLSLVTATAILLAFLSVPVPGTKSGVSSDNPLIQSRTCRFSYRIRGTGFSRLQFKMGLARTLHNLLPSFLSLISQSHPHLILL